MRRQSLALLTVAVVAVAVVVTAVLGGVFTTTSTLIVTDDDGTQQIEIAVEEGSEVTIEYTHSVERTLVSDVYVVSGETLTSDRMYFSSFGAGLPAFANVTREGDRYVYEPQKKQYDPLIVSTGPIAGHDLVVDGQRYDLVGIADSGTVQIRVERERTLNYGIF